MTEIKDTKEDAREKAIEYTREEVMEIIDKHARSDGRDILIPNSFKERDGCFYTMGKCFPFKEEAKNKQVLKQLWRELCDVYGTENYFKSED